MTESVICYQLHNLSHGRILLADRVQVCDTPFKRCLGMIFRKHVVPLFFKFPKSSRASLHSWFCPSGMDLIFLNEEHKVVELKSDWKSQSFYKPVQQFKYLAELPCETIKKSGTRIGDLVVLARIENISLPIGGRQGCVRQYE